MDIYVITYTMIMPGTPEGCVSDLFEFATTDVKKAEKFFKDLTLTQTYIRKELWLIHADGRRNLMKEARWKDAN